MTVLTSPLATGFTSLVAETAEAFHNAIPGSQISVDFPGYPNYELRNYDYEGIGKVADLVIIMGYDMFIWDDYDEVDRIRG